MTGVKRLKVFKMASLATCFIGAVLESTEDCHKLHYTTSYAKPTQLMCIASLSNEDQVLLKHRCGLEVDFPNDATICLHHKKTSLDLFSSLQNNCCNPFNLHSKSKPKQLRIISLAQAHTIQKTSIKAGMKICLQCRQHLYKISAKVPLQKQVDEDYVQQQDMEKQLDQCFTAIGLSPCKMSKLNPRDQGTYMKRKVQDLETKTTEMLQLCAASSSTSQPVPIPISSAVSDVENLVTCLKQKLSLTTSSQEQIKLLTLAPQSWTIQKTMEEFGMGEHLVRRARELRKDQGILPDISNSQGRALDTDTVQKIIDFFNRDDISRLLPGKKDFKSVKEGQLKVHKQKRLIVMNLNEAYQIFKEAYPDIKVGISRFCSVRPKECITVGARGTHSVCVCVYHQNVKLMLSSFPVANQDEKFTKADLMNLIVCSTQNMQCMLHRCEDCPGTTKLEDFLNDKLSDHADSITYKQWVTTDRTTLVEHTMASDDYLELLTEKVHQLTAHHYIAKHQSQYLHQVKEELKEEECVILLDFAENYSFIVQDAAQGYHWDNSQCTLHPFVIYHKEDEHLKCSSLCIVSDCLKHDTEAVHTFLSSVIPEVKNLIPSLKKIHYFSDGAASQYKNRKNFLNLLHHFPDFGVSAEWNFFATSHGKSPCDGIGGTVKRAATRASLQAIDKDQILTPEDLFKWAQKTISGVKFMWIGKEHVTSMADKLQSRFTKAIAVPGTRDNHCFKAVSETSIEVSRVSGIAGFLVHYDMEHEEEEVPRVQIIDLTPGQYVTCIYDNCWWVGSIREVSEAEQDVQIQFMHPHGPAKTFFWPTREDLCWVPLQHIISKIDVPCTTTGRLYTIQECHIKTCQSFLKDFR